MHESTEKNERQVLVKFVCIWSQLCDRMRIALIPRLTVSRTRLVSSSRRSVSVESREVVAMRTPYARWDRNRSDTSSASVCIATDNWTFMNLLPSKLRMVESVDERYCNVIDHK